MNIVFHGSIGERTGYQVHASRFTEQLAKLATVKFEGKGDVHISLLDVVTASQIIKFPPSPSILYTVWESTQYPAQFLVNLKYYDQLWLVSEWEKSCAIAQGVPEEFIRVVHEGVDPEVYKPKKKEPGGENIVYSQPNFNFVHVGQWQARKSTKEICESFLKAFPDNPNVRLYLSADTLFPSDNYNSTEERLKAYGLEDSRIIPIHYEARPDYIRRLQAAHCVVTCARSEGWNLPLIESMACGIPSICSDFGGSTEYAGDAIVVRISELKKPEGIYGNWDVPGQWGEPDYNNLVEKMKDVYENYSEHKEKALKLSEMIRTKFSWAKAAETAMEILNEFSRHLEKPFEVVNTEKEIKSYARSHGYDITDMKKRSTVFAVDCWPDTPAKMETLKETIEQIHRAGYEVIVTSHYPVPTEVMTMADYFVYEKKDILSGDDHPVYWRQLPDGSMEQKRARVQYHAVAGLNNLRNGINFARGKFDWIYQMSFDVEVDLNDWLNKVHNSDKDMICLQWEGDPKTFGGHLMAAKTEVMDKIYPYLSSWEEYASRYPEHRFLAERWLYEHVSKIYDIEKNVEFIKMDIVNRFDQADRTLWGEDRFLCHFVDGAFLQIIGSSSMSNNEYDIAWSTKEAENVYNLKQKVGMWSRSKTKYYQDWTVKASLGGNVKFEHKIDLKGKNVIISMGSKALGDTIAWIPYVDEFRKKHECKVYCSTWWRNIFDYPDIEFITPGSEIKDIYATYEVGCFDDQLDKNVKNWRETNLQKVASDILGLEYEPIRAKLKYQIPKRGNGNPAKPYVCFSEFSTMKNKLWNREGAWQKIIDYLNAQGYECISISAEKGNLEGIISHNGQPIEQTINDVAGCDFYIGLNAGPSWIAYALNKPCIMITGVSIEENDFPNEHRISIDVCNPGCFHDPSLPIDRGFDWCPRNKDYICTKDITEERVIEEIEKVMEVLHASNDKEKGKSLSGEHAKRDKKQRNNFREGEVTRATS
jgi:autotransporter strand-loop-strand O-heptosyltransferase